MSADAVRAYYGASAAAERASLSRSVAGRIELAVNLHHIRRRLPPAGRVLDIGGGTGPYALALAADGHSVALADLSPELLALAREEIGRAAPEVRARIEDVVEADARDLGRFADASFDAVLSLGPFYHLPEPDDRRRAAGELARVLKPGGWCFVASMPRSTLLRWWVEVVAAGDAGEPGALRAALRDGAYHTDEPGRFTGGYFPRPGEPEALLADAGVETLATVASEGIAGALEGPDAGAWERPEAFAELLEVCLATAEEPGSAGASVHMLLVGRKAG